MIVRYVQRENKLHPEDQGCESVVEGRREELRKRRRDGRREEGGTGDGKKLMSPDIHLLSRDVTNSTSFLFQL